MVVETILHIVNEADAHIATLIDPIEGFRDDLRLDIVEETRTVVQSRLDELLRRKALTKNVIHSARQLIADIEALLADGYPVIPIEEVSANVYTDLETQRRTLAAAFALMKPPALTEHVEAHIEKRPTPVS
jgi:hypothetical protein